MLLVAHTPAVVSVCSPCPAWSSAVESSPSAMASTSINVTPPKIGGPWAGLFSRAQNFRALSTMHVNSQPIKLDHSEL